MKIIHAGVVGLGSIGINHARIYSELCNCQLVAVYDVNPIIAENVASKYGAKSCRSLEEFAELVDVASVATPTESHHKIGTFLLNKGKHLLIEKPIAINTSEALDLANQATINNCILQVGHIERFNPALESLEKELSNPRFLEVTRLSPYPKRSIDIGVVLDLMIHDLEILLHLVRSPVTSCDSVGIAVLSPGEDIANVRIRFENGCVANLTASRISRDKVRKIRIFQEDTYLSLNYQNQSGYILRIKKGVIKRERVKIVKGEPLQRELVAFITCVREGSQPRVSGYQATVALDLGIRITKQIQEANSHKQLT